MERKRATSSQTNGPSIIASTSLSQRFNPAPGPKEQYSNFSLHQIKGSVFLSLQFSIAVTHDSTCTCVTLGISSFTNQELTIVIIYNNLKGGLGLSHVLEWNSTRTKFVVTCKWQCPESLQVCKNTLCNQPITHPNGHTL